MKKTLHNPKQLFDPKFFTHVVSVSDARLVFISGQVSYDADGVVVGQRRHPRAKRSGVPGARALSALVRRRLERRRENERLHGRRQC